MHRPARESPGSGQHLALEKKGEGGRGKASKVAVPQSTTNGTTVCIMQRQQPPPTTIIIATTTTGNLEAGLPLVYIFPPRIGISNVARIRLWK